MVDAPAPSASALEPQLAAFELYVMRRAGDLEPFERERRRLLLQP